MQKSLLTITLIFISFKSYSQYHAATEIDSSIYVELENRDDWAFDRAIEELAALKAAYFIIPNNQDAIYQLGVQYYRDFIKPYKKEYKGYLNYNNKDMRIHDSIAYYLNEKYFKNSFYKNPADSALYYFLKIDSMDEETEKGLFFAINQLKCYVDSDSTPVDLHSRVSSDEYIPYWYFADLGDNWKCDYSKNYIHRIYNSILHVPDSTSSLFRMNEEPLYLLEVPKNSEILRFTFDRSFDEDIITRVEKHGDKVTLYWKMSRKSKYGNYKGIKKQGSRELNLKTWDYILELMNEANFKDLPNIDDNLISGEFITLDGADWFIEHKKQDYYKAYFAKSPPKEVEMLCLYLMELSKTAYKFDNWEPRYINYNMTLTENGGYVLSQDILDTIISYLNENLDKDIAAKACYYYIKFNSKGKLTKIKCPPDMNFFSDKWSAFENRKYRKEIKRTLRKLDLSYLGLTSPLYINMNVRYNKENHTFRKYKYY